MKKGKKRHIFSICDDLLEEILCRLPCNFASLTRFKCVSRSWNCLICSDSFVHRYNSLRRRYPLSGLLSQCQSQSQFRRASLVFNSDNLFISATPEHDNLLRLSTKQPIYAQFTIHASSGGLLLCTAYYLPKYSFIYDPVTGQKHLIPPLRQPIVIGDTCGLHVYEYDGLRRRRRFIALRLSMRSNRDVGGRVQVMQFDSAVGKWQVTNYPVERLLFFDRAAFVRNEIFHWVTRHGNQIAIYDPKEPSFRVTRSPLMQSSPSWRTVILGEYGGRLCCCCMYYEGYKGLTMWVLDDDPDPDPDPDSDSDSDSQWLFKSKHSLQLQEMGCKQVLGSDTVPVPYIVCFDAEAVYLTWRQQKIDGSYLINFVRYHLGSTMLEFVRQIDEDWNPRQYFPFSFIAPAWQPTRGPSM